MIWIELTPQVTLMARGLSMNEDDCRTQLRV